MRRDDGVSVKVLKADPDASKKGGQERGMEVGFRFVNNDQCRSRIVNLCSELAGDFEYQLYGQRSEP